MFSYICDMKAKYNREYLGVLITTQNYSDILKREGRDQINFHNKHLRAYKKGKTHFVHGIRIDEKGEKLGPAIHPVQAKLTQIDDGLE